MFRRSSHHAFLPFLLAVIVTATTGLSATGGICADRNVGGSAAVTSSAALVGVPGFPCPPSRACEIPAANEAERAGFETTGASSSCCHWRASVEPAGLLLLTREATGHFGSPVGNPVGNDRSTGPGDETTAVRVFTPAAPASPSLRPARYRTSVFLL